MSVFKVKRLAEAGDLSAASDFRGVQRFDPSQVEKLRRRLEAGGAALSAPASSKHGLGKVHAHVFRLFGERRELREIVIECEITTDAVVELRRQYAELGRDFLISSRGLEELRELLDWTTEPTEKNLLAAVAARSRFQFERGQRAAGETETHNTKGKTSAKPHTGATGESRHSHEKSEGALRGDPAREDPNGRGDSAT